MEYQNRGPGTGTTFADIDFNAGLRMPGAGVDIDPAAIPENVSEIVGNLSNKAEALLERIGKIENAEHDGITLAAPSTDPRVVGQEMFSEGPQGWCRKGGHPNIGELIEQRALLAHELRDIKTVVHTALL